MSSYADTINRLFTLSEKRGIHPSLESIEKLCTLYNDPQNSFHTIHVAGTNGKGSVCMKISAALQKEGYLCGLYTSPHISSFCERIQVGGEPIPEEEISLLVEEIEQAMRIHSLSASFFEIATLIAFLYFRKKKVEVAVIEVGLGGKWDATNVVDPLISVITSIGYDHVEILGNTLEEIAKEKGGIIKKGKKVVVGPDVPYDVFEKIAQEERSLLYQSQQEDGNYDRENQGIARLALSLLQEEFPLSSQSIAKGLEARPPCRFERHKRKKEIILDVAHNPHGVKRLLECLSITYPNYQYRFVLAFSSGKDVASCARLIQEQAVAIHLVQGKHPRLARVEEMLAFFSPLAGPVYEEPSVAEGINQALLFPADRLEVVVVCGTFFIMSEARKALGIPVKEDLHIWYDPFKICLPVQENRPLSLT